MKFEKLIKLAAFLAALTDRGLSYSLSAKKRSGAFCFHKGKLVLLPLLLMGLLTLPYCGDNGDSGSNGGGNSPSPDPPPSPSPDPPPTPGPGPSPSPSPSPSPPPGALCDADADAGTGFNGGDGSEGDPYLICTYEQLNMIRNKLRKHYQLANAIDASGEEDWTPIGDDSSQFTGSLDGGGYSIRNLTVDIAVSSPEPIYGGFFGYIESGAVISNIALRDVSITVTQLTGYAAYVGGLGGFNSGTISNSYATGTVAYNSSMSVVSNVGGLVGQITNGTINNSYAGVNVLAMVIQSPRLGGLVGKGDSGTINSSYATGRASCAGAASCSGALIGGLVGERNSAAIVTNSYWDTVSTEQSGGCGGAWNCGGGATGLTTSEMQDGSSASGLGSGFDLTGGAYPKLYLCEIDSTTNACSGSFSTELLPGQ